MRAALITLVTSVFGFAMCHVAEASKEKVLYSFCSQRNCADGDAPRASLTYVNGALYGTTVLGGNDSCDSGCGTLFKLNPETGAEAVLYAFPVSDTDGYHPSGNLTNIDGVLYGTTLDGGAYGIEYDGGTVYSFNLSNNSETVLYSFCSKNKCKDGDNPAGSTISHSVLYGTTLYGGKDYGQLGGTVFSLNLNTGFEKVRNAFQYEGAAGYTPAGSPVDISGSLYGVTTFGGAGSCYGAGFDGCGTIFSLDLKSRVETVLHSFANGDTDGAFPYASLIEVGQLLYGTTAYGGLGSCFHQEGATGCGTVFSLDIQTGTEKVLYFFCGKQNCTDGAAPTAGLIKVNGKLYGTTNLGGDHNAGTVFTIDPKTGAEKVLYSFCSKQNCEDGLTPGAGLIDVNGTLYGATESGGANGGGTVFSITP